MSLHPANSVTIVDSCLTLAQRGEIILVHNALRSHVCVWSLLWSELRKYLVYLALEENRQVL
jgi:hypothetical protein